MKSPHDNSESGRIHFCGRQQPDRAWHNLNQIENFQKIPQICNSPSTRRVEIGGIASRANGFGMPQIGRNVTDDVDRFLKGKRYLIHDRDPLYTREFLSMLADAGIESVKLPPRAPNLNAYAERFVRTIKEGCLERMIFFGEDSLRNAIFEFVAHYDLERN